MRAFLFAFLLTASAATNIHVGARALAESNTPRVGRVTNGTAAGAGGGVRRPAVTCSGNVSAYCSDLADSNCTTSSQLSAAECNAWVDFFDDTNGMEWNLDVPPGQSISKFRPDPCALSFHDRWGMLAGGVECSGSHVTQLVLTELDMTGTIPGTIGQLSALTNLDLHYNELGGTIPASVWQLSALTSLVLSTNNLYGTIPDSIGQLIALTYLDLSNIYLDGTIPDSIGQLTALTSLDLLAGTNNLDGTIPGSIGQLTALTRLVLCDNNLDGTIPDSIGQLTALTSVCLRNNTLTGLVPALPWKQYTDYCTIGGNPFTCPLPGGATDCNGGGDYFNVTGPAHQV
eukprot:g1639.t1